MPRILVVEDEKLLAAIITDALAGSYEVLCAFNVEDAANSCLALR